MAQGTQTEENGSRCFKFTEQPQRPRLNSCTRKLFFFTVFIQTVPHPTLYGSSLWPLVVIHTLLNSSSSSSSSCLYYYHWQRLRHENIYVTDQNLYFFFGFHSFFNVSLFCPAQENTIVCCKLCKFLTLCFQLCFIVLERENIPKCQLSFAIYYGTLIIQYNRIKVVNCNPTLLPQFHCCFKFVPLLCFMRH